MKQATLRLPDDLHAKLTVMARRERRSLHNLILFLLEQAVQREEGGTP